MKWLHVFVTAPLGVTAHVIRSTLTTITPDLDRIRLYDRRTPHLSSVCRPRVCRACLSRWVVSHAFKTHTMSGPSQHTLPHVFHHIRPGPIHKTIPTVVVRESSHNTNASLLFLKHRSFSLGLWKSTIGYLSHSWTRIADQVENE